MEKNNQYVGVDEKYIPEDENHSNNTLNSEIKNDIHNIYHGAKEYVTDKNNQEKLKRVGKKGLKIATGFGIVYLIIEAIIFILVVAFIIMVFSKVMSNW